jgi:hypothetical protein
MSGGYAREVDDTVDIHYATLAAAAQHADSWKPNAKRHHE